MFRQLLNLWRGRRRKGLYPESLWRVSIVDDRVEVIDQAGKHSAIVLSDVHAIVADMAGDFFATDWWVLDGKSGCILAFPWGASGEDEVIESFKELPGFDWDKLGQAVRTIQDSSFVVWKRDRRTS